MSLANLRHEESAKTFTGGTTTMRGSVAPSEAATSATTQAHTHVQDLAVTLPAVRTTSGNPSLAFHHNTSLSVARDGPSTAVQSTQGGYGAISLAPQRRKRNGAATMTLFVRTKENGGEDGREVDVTNSEQEPGVVATLQQSGSGQVAHADGGGGGGGEEHHALAVVENAISSLSEIPNQVMEVAPQVAKAIARPVMTAAFVLLFFVLVDVYTLIQSRKSLQRVLDSATSVNLQLLTVSAALTERYELKKEYITVLSEPVRRTSPRDIERASEELAELKSARDHSIDTLYKHLRYPGPKEDVEFLVEQHVSYEMRLQRLAEAELEWLRTSHNSLRTRLLRHKQTTFVIGHFADSFAESVSERNLQSVRELTYPLREDDDAAASDGTNAGNDTNFSSSNNATSDGSATKRRRLRRRRRARKTAKPAVFQSFIEVTDAGGSDGSSNKQGHKLEEVSVAAHDYDDGSRKTETSLISTLLASRVFVFIAVCALLVVFLYVN